MVTRPGPTVGWSEYMKDWRNRHPLAVEKNRMQSRARNRALTRLKGLFPEEFNGLYQAEILLERIDSNRVIDKPTCNRARSRALNFLKLIHPDEFQCLYEEEILVEMTEWEMHHDGQFGR